MTSVIRFSFQRSFTLPRSHSVAISLICVISYNVQLKLNGRTIIIQIRIRFMPFDFVFLSVFVFYSICSVLCSFLHIHLLVVSVCKQFHFLFMISIFSPFRIHLVHRKCIVVAFFLFFFLVNFRAHWALLSVLPLVFRFSPFSEGLMGLNANDLLFLSLFLRCSTLFATSISILSPFNAACVVVTTVSMIAVSVAIVATNATAALLLVMFMCLLLPLLLMFLDFAYKTLKWFYMRFYLTQCSSSSVFCEIASSQLCKLLHSNSFLFLSWFSRCALQNCAPSTD